MQRKYISLESDKKKCEKKLKKLQLVKKKNIYLCLTKNNI